jgi:hypothetical protein
MNRYKIMRTNYPHPTVTSGQHTNGPAMVWVEVDGVWYRTGSTREHKIVAELEANGPSRIIAGTWNEYEQRKAGE